MSSRQPDEYYIALERRLRALAPGAKRVLPAEPYRWFLEYVDAGEYGLAVEVASESLPEEASTPEVRELAGGLLREAEIMGLPDEVTQRLLSRTG
ncbi:MAG: hypothetical protein ACRDLN_13170 [Solirubrobacteraceae bacterium]